MTTTRSAGARALRYLAIALAVYVGLALALDAAIGFFQPRSGPTIVLRTFDAEGEAHDKVLTPIELDDALYVMSAHWFRGWYHRARENPRVALVEGDDVRPHRAIVLGPAEAERFLHRLTGGSRGAGFWATRAMFLFAPLKPVRLEPVGPETAGAPARTGRRSTRWLECSSPIPCRPGTHRAPDGSTIG